MVADALVGACDDALANRLSFGREGAEEGRRGEVVRDVFDLPGKVVCVLHTGVGAKTVERRVAVDGVAEAVDCVAGI